LFKDREGTQTAEEPDLKLIVCLGRIFILPPNSVFANYFKSLKEKIQYNGKKIEFQKDISTSI